MRAIDTNVLVRLITRDDEAQLERAEAFVEKGAWVSHLVLAEASWVLKVAYALDDAAIAKTVTMLLEHETLVLQDPDVVVAALDHYHGRPSLGFSDCLVLALARRAGHMPLGTFDKRLAKLDGVERV